MKNAASTIGLATMLVVPLAVGVAFAASALSVSPLESAASVEPSTGQVEAAERTDSTPTTVSYVSGDAFPVSSQATGIITELNLKPGAAVSNGSIAMKVDGLPVVAYVAVSPLYRDIVRGSVGDDIATAQQLLKDLGYLTSAPDGIAGFETARAIREFNGAYGYGDDNPVLAVSSLLWIPTDSGAPATVSVRVGSEVMAGTELYTTTEGGDYIAIDSEPVDVATVLTVNDVVVGLQPDQTAVTDPETVLKIATYIGDQTSLYATLAPVEPRTVGTLPASALVTDATGTVCFFSNTNSAGVAVSPVDGSFGLVDVDADFVGTPVLLNPRDVRQDLACD